MRKATATYNAPEGDSDVVEMGGVEFKSGEAVDLNSDDHSHLINKLPGNKHFDIEIGDEVERPKRGRPSNAEKAAKDAESAEA
ncbi:hypothetical protein ACWAT4_21600 [Bradyrhizobium manausense]